MTSQGHKHHQGKKASEHPPPKYDLSGLHRDWRTWLIIGLMIAAIGTYVLTLDESVQPSGPAQSGVSGSSSPVNSPK